MKSKCEESKPELTADLTFFVITSLLKLYKYYTTNNTGQISWTSEYKTNLVPRVPRPFPGKRPGDQVGGKLGVPPPPPQAQHGNLGFEAVSNNFTKVGLARPPSYNYKRTEIDTHQHTLSHFQSIQIHKCS